MTARVVTTVWLVAVWVALWEALSVANLLSGLVAAVVLQVMFPRVGTGSRLRFRPVAALRLLGLFLRKLVEANLVVAWEVITPDNTRVREGIIAVPVLSRDPAVIAMVANAISLTPGTLTIEVWPEPDPVLFVHVLHLHDIAEVRRDILELERAVLRAFGSDEAVAAMDRIVNDHEGVAP